MKSTKIENAEQLVQNGGDMAAIAAAVARQQQDKNYILLNKELLPSKGKFYPDDIKVKKLSPIDLKNLSTMTANTIDGIMNSTIAHCVSGINVNDILIGDKFWFIFYLRQLTYNDMPFNIKYHCENCEKYGIYQMTFKDIQTNYLADDFNTNVTLDNGDEIELCFPTIGNEITMNQMLREPEKYSVTGELDDQMLNIAFHIKKLNGKEISIMKAYEYITSGIDGYSFSTFCNAMADVNFGIKPYITIVCEKCNKEIYETVNISPEYFLPKIKKA